MSDTTTIAFSETRSAQDISRMMYPFLISGDLDLAEFKYEMVGDENADAYTGLTLTGGSYKTIAQDIVHDNSDAVFV